MENLQDHLRALHEKLHHPNHAARAESGTDASYGYRDTPHAMPPDPPQAVWRIWSNLHRQWYLPDARGYTPNIEESGRFMPMEALQIYQNSTRGWDPHNPFPISITLVPVNR